MKVSDFDQSKQDICENHKQLLMKVSDFDQSKQDICENHKQQTLVKVSHLEQDVSSQTLKCLYYL